MVPSLHLAQGARMGTVALARGGQGGDRVHGQVDSHEREQLDTTVGAGATQENSFPTVVLDSETCSPY